MSMLVKGGEIHQVAPTEMSMRLPNEKLATTNEERGYIFELTLRKYLLTTNR